MPEYSVKIEQAAPQWVAAARCVCAVREIPQRIRPLLGVGWDFVRRNGMKNYGINVAIYRGTPDGVLMKAGPSVAEAFEGSGEVLCVTTPAGTVATLAHIGPYHRMGEAHAAIRSFCAANGHRLEGTNWEIYGHWTDDESKLRTDVYYLVTAS